MALKIKYVDDIDGQPIRDGGAMRFSLGDDVYEIDLSRANQARLRAVLAPYIAASRRARYQSTQLPKVGPRTPRRT